MRRILFALATFGDFCHSNPGVAVKNNSGQKTNAKRFFPAAS
jgi:hypothetical protein